MPVDDWTRVSAGTFHDFHGAWIAELRRVLNRGLLPDGYYALTEQVATQVIADVLTLQDLGGAPGGTGGDDEGKRDTRDGNGAAGLAVATAPPRAAICDSVSEAMLLAARRRRLVIRHTTWDR